MRKLLIVSMLMLMGSECHQHQEPYIYPDKEEKFLKGYCKRWKRISRMQKCELKCERKNFSWGRLQSCYDDCEDRDHFCYVKRGEL